jgi:hypothetical protein
MAKILYSFLAASLLFTSYVSMGQTLPTDAETKKITYQETVVLDSVPKQEIFDRATEWLTNSMKTNKFDVNDKVNYKLMHEGNFAISYTYDFKYKSNNTVTYNLSLDVKEGKYRFTITDFKIYDDKIGAKSAQTLESYYAKMKTGSKPEFTNKFTTEVNGIIDEMKKFMVTGKGEEKDDW